MRPPNSRHSEARKIHIANLVFEMPVLVSCSMWAWDAAASWSTTAVSANGLDLLVILSGACSGRIDVGGRPPAGVGLGVAPVPAAGGVRRLEGPAVDARHDDRSAD